MLGRAVKQLNIGQVRSAHTRSKKINVQALKNHGRRFKGEVFPVSEGHMRLKLHPEGTAAYVLKNQPLPLPELKAADAQQMRREIQLQAKAASEEKLKAETEEAPASQEDQQVQKVKSFLDNLDFPVANAANVAPAASEGAKSQASQASQPSASPSDSDEPRKKFAWQNKFVRNITEKK